MKDKGYTQIDHELLMAVTAADITRAALKTMLVVIRFTLGYHQEEVEIGYTTLRKFTGLSRPAVKEAIRELISCKIIARVRQGSTIPTRQAAIYRINTDFSTWTSPLDKSTYPEQGKRTYPEVAENLPSTGQVATPATSPIKIKDNSKDNKDNNDHLDPEVSILSKKIINYYFKTYRAHTGKPHPDLKPEQRQRVIAELAAFGAEYGMGNLQQIRIIIDYHFQRKLKTDYNINHFATPGILKNLYFKKLYYAADNEA